MLDHIGSFLNLCYCIIKASQKLKDIHLIYSILLSLLYSTIQDIIRQNLLGKKKSVILNMMITKLITITDQNKQNCQVKKTEKKVKTEQLALLVKSGSSDTRGSDRENKKKLKKGKRKSKPTDEYHTCHQKRHWSNNCLNTLNERKISRGSYYNLRLRKLKKKPYIEFTQENLIEFLIQCIYLYIHQTNSLYYMKSSLL